MEGYRTDILRVYAGYWNAFESLVEAVLIFRPEKKQPGIEKQAALTEHFRERKLDINSVTEAYQQIVNPGFVGKAIYALKVCFPNESEAYIEHCFRMKPAKDRLYDIRNSINHGDASTDDFGELHRVASRWLKLWMIVFGMLGIFLPIDRPIDPDP